MSKRKCFAICVLLQPQTAVVGVWSWAPNQDFASDQDEATWKAQPSQLQQGVVLERVGARPLGSSRRPAVHLRRDVRSAEVTPSAAVGIAAVQRVESASRHPIGDQPLQHQQPAVRSQRRAVKGDMETAAIGVPDGGAAGSQSPTLSSAPRGEVTAAVGADGPLVIPVPIRVPVPWPVLVPAPPIPYQVRDHPEVASPTTTTAVPATSTTTTRSAVAEKSLSPTVVRPVLVPVPVPMVPIRIPFGRSPVMPVPLAPSATRIHPMPATVAPPQSPSDMAADVIPATQLPGTTTVPSGGPERTTKLPLESGTPAPSTGLPKATGAPSHSEASTTTPAAPSHSNRTLELPGANLSSENSKKMMQDAKNTTVAANTTVNVSNRSTTARADRAENGSIPSTPVMENVTIKANTWSNVSSFGYATESPTAVLVEYSCLAWIPGNTKCAGICYEGPTVFMRRCIVKEWPPIIRAVMVHPMLLLGRTCTPLGFTEGWAVPDDFYGAAGVSTYMSPGWSPIFDRMVGANASAAAALRDSGAAWRRAHPACDGAEDIG